MKLNKGEWSELFVGLLSLDRGELKLYKSPLEIKIKDISYDGKYFFNKQHIKNLDIKEFENSLNKGSGVFSLSPEIVKAIGFKKGSSKSKIDIMLKYLLQNQHLKDGFGIKSSIAGKPSLLNASRATNFRFSIQNLNKPLSKDKAKDLVETINKKFIKFECCLSNVFSNNLKMIDTNLDKILADILITYYQRKGNKIPDLVEKTFPDLKQQIQVKQRVKDFLYYTCVGMFPTQEWDGKEQIVGTLVYTKQHELFCLHRIDINNFKDYLYENSVLDTASTTRHQFGYLIDNKNQILLDLNLLIRMD